MERFPCRQRAPAQWNRMRGCVVLVRSSWGSATGDTRLVSTLRAQSEATHGQRRVLLLALRRGRQRVQVRTVQKSEAAARHLDSRYVSAGDQKTSSRGLAWPWARDPCSATRGSKGKIPGATALIAAAARTPLCTPLPLSGIIVDGKRTKHFWHFRWHAWEFCIGMAARVSRVVQFPVFSIHSRSGEDGSSDG